MSSCLSVSLSISLFLSLSLSFSLSLSPSMCLPLWLAGYPHYCTTVQGHKRLVLEGISQFFHDMDQQQKQFAASDRLVCAHFSRGALHWYKYKLYVKAGLLSTCCTACCDINQHHTVYQLAPVCPSRWWLKPGTWLSDHHQMSP